MTRKKGPRGFVRFLADMFQSMAPRPSGLTRGGPGDPLAAQRYVRARPLTIEECRAIYEENWLGGAIVDTLAEDLVQAGWRFVYPENAELERGIANEYANLALKRTLHDAVRFALVEGESYLGLGLREGATPRLDRPPATVTGVDYVHIIRRDAVTQIEYDEDPLSPHYGEPLYYHVRTTTEESPVRVHAARVCPIIIFPSLSGSGGVPIYRRLYLVLQVLDNALWSVGQAVYQLVFKVLKIDYEEFKKVAAERGLTPYQLMLHWAQDINSLTMFVMDKGTREIPPDEIEFPAVATNLNALDVVRDFLIMALSAATRIPQSRLIGNEQGKLSGAEWDAQTYYGRIRALQETRLQPQIERITDYLLMAMGYDPESVNYRIEFNPLYVSPPMEQAQITKALADADETYVRAGILTPDEVRKMRFGLSPLLSELEPVPTAPEGEGGEEQSASDAYWGAHARY